MFSLAILVQVGCVTTGVQQDELDAAVKVAVEDALAEKGCLTEADVAAHLTTADLDAFREEADASYAPAPPEGESYTTSTSLEEVRSELDTRVSAIEADFRRVREDETWTVDPSGAGDYTALHAAVAALGGVRIDSDATITLQLVGDHSYSEPVYFHHPDGGRIRVVGDPSDSSIVTLTFNGSSGIVVDEVSALGYLGDLTLIGDGVTAEANGLTVTDGSVATIGPMVVERFGGSGVLVTSSSTLLRDTPQAATLIEGWLYVSNSGGVGVNIDDGSVANVPLAVASGSGSSGFAVQGSSYLEAAYSRAQDSQTAGYAVLYGSFAYLNYAESTGGAGYGFNSGYSSGILATYAASSDNAAYGYTAGDGALLNANYSTSDGDGGGYYSTADAYVQAVGCSIPSVTDAYAFKQSYNAYLVVQGCTGESSADTPEGNDVTDFIWGP